MDGFIIFTHFSEHIEKYYKIDRNIPFIDNQNNNNKAAVLAMGCSNYEFFEFLLTSEKIKEKKYSLNNLSLTLSKNQYIDANFAFLLIDCVENKKEIFEDYRLKTKKVFLQSCIDFFISSEDLLDSDNNFTYHNQSYFFDFLKKFKINPYEDKYHVIDSLIYNKRLKTLDYLIDSAKKNEDKEKILYHPYSDVSEEVEDFLKVKIKTHETYKSYKELKEKLEPNNSKSISRKIKI